MPITTCALDACGRLLDAAAAAREATPGPRHTIADLTTIPDIARSEA